MTTILALSELGAVLAFAFYAVRGLMAAHKAEAGALKLYGDEKLFADKLTDAAVLVTNENKRLKLTITTLEAINADLLTKIKFTDPGAVISDELHKLSPGFKKPS